jgi:hypothetical protein
MTSGVYKDLTGEKFGRLEVVERIKKNKRIYYKCICNCESGTEKLIRSDSLTSGKTVSCGCYNSEITSEISKINNTTHGMSKTKIYNVWGHMISRCENKDTWSYKNYGGRGIIICKEWRSDFMNFYQWSMENGYKEGLTIERIDVNGNYEPRNCRWATQLEQANNKTSTLYIEIDGVTKSSTEWDRLNNLPINCVAQRYRHGKRGRDLIRPLRENLKKQSGHKYITWYEKLRKWRFGLKIDGKAKHLGYFDDLQDAIQAKQEYINKLNDYNGNVV